MTKETLELNIEEKMHSNPFDAEICAETGSKIRSFLYQLAEKVTDYRSLHSLTEQVRHQYHGRFAIELIQNAYDAVSRATNLEESLGRIEMRLELDEGFGTLYVANDGAPFSRSNFESISRLRYGDSSRSSTRKFPLAKSAMDAGKIRNFTSCW